MKFLGSGSSPGFTDNFRIFGTGLANCTPRKRNRTPARLGISSRSIDPDPYRIGRIYCRYSYVGKGTCHWRCSRQRRGMDFYCCSCDIDTPGGSSQLKSTLDTKYYIIATDRHCNFKSTTVRCIRQCRDA